MTPDGPDGDPDRRTRRSRRRRVGPDGADGGSSPSGGPGGDSPGAHPGRPFDPPLALSSLSGAADADWARTGAPHAGAALLGGIALDDPTRSAARELVGRGREEFLPADPYDFLDEQLAALDGVPVLAGWNVRAATPDPVARAARVCRAHGAPIEVNAHCRQAEMCAAGAGESLLRAPDRLCAFVRAAARTGAVVSVKVRAGLDGVDLPAVSRAAVGAGADWIHVDAMDSEPAVGAVARAVGDRAVVVANNGVRDLPTVREYLRYGADAVSVGRPSTDPVVLRRVLAALRALDGAREAGVRPGTRPAPPPAGGHDRPRDCPVRADRRRAGRRRADRDRAGTAPSPARGADD